MFRCELCLENIAGRMFKLITKIRKKTYTHWVKGKEKTGRGWEIERENKVCETCYEGSRTNQENLINSTKDLGKKSGFKTMSTYR